jgi:hypothetical protein
LAECTFPEYWVPFTEAAPTADRVVIGTVIENLDAELGSPDTTARFVLRVDETLRGKARGRITVRYVTSDDPRNQCPGVTFLAAIGWRVAIAQGARVAGIPRDVTTFALINHTFEGGSIVGIQHLSVEQVRHLAALPDTSTAQFEQPVMQLSLELVSLGLLLGTVVCLACFRRVATGRETQP